MSGRGAKGPYRSTRRYSRYLLFDTLPPQQKAMDSSRVVGRPGIGFLNRQDCLEIHNSGLDFACILTEFFDDNQPLIHDISVTFFEDQHAGTGLMHAL